MKSLFESYIQEAEQTEQPVEDKQPVEQEVKKTPTGSFASEEDFFKSQQSKEMLQYQWIKKLNTRFKPYITFKLIMSMNENNALDVYLAAKSMDSQMDRRLYHVTPEVPLNGKVFKEIIGMADEQTKAKTLN